jgi:C-terminal processing protease CtpA/Prc
MRTRLSSEAATAAPPVAHSRRRATAGGVKLGFRLSDDNVVLSVLPGGPAEAAGFATGDLVLALDGSALDGRPAVPIFQQPPAPLPTDRKVVVTRKAPAAAAAPPAAADAVPAKKTSDGRNVLLF